jgi:phosphoribosyl 1,2-cyclic phosphodiesterase/FixJ family two-component response regulator
MKKPKILLIDDLSSTGQNVRKTLGDHYEIVQINSTLDYIKVIKREAPDLILCELILSKVGGITILKTLKKDPLLKAIPFVFYSQKVLIQDYHSALELGASQFIPKNIESEKFRLIIDSCFQDPVNSSDPITPFNEIPKVLVPLYQEPALPPPPKSYAKFWGTRGSTAVSGAEFTRYGGNTSCLEIRPLDPEKCIIIDAGTGIRPLAGTLLSSPVKEIHLFIGHAHWDHIIGFPFFIPVYIPKYTIHIYSASGFHKNMEETFSGMLDYDYYPVNLSDMQAKFVFHELDGNPVSIDEIKIHTAYAYHPGGTVCFKVETPNQCLGYVTDNEFLQGYHGDPKAIGYDHPLLETYRLMVDFFRGCDTLVHEAQYFPKEYLNKTGWGHSSVTNATVLVKHTRPKLWIVTHHDFNHDDEMLQHKAELHRAIMADCGIKVDFAMAHDGMVLAL